MTLQRNGIGGSKKNMQNKFKEEIKKINQATSERYNKRLQEKGEGAYALGWGKKTYQFKRFFALLHAAEPGDFNNQIVLDIGCGFADLYPFLKKRGFKLKKYIGVDINKNFIDIAEKNIRNFFLKP